MWSCDQNLVTVAFLREKLSQPHFYKDLTRKIAFFQGSSWFKFNNLGLTLCKNLKFCTSVAKVSKLKVRKFWGPNPLLHPPTSWIGLKPKYLDWEQNTIKRYCKYTRITNVDWLFVAMHYVPEKLIRKNENLLLNFGYFSLFRKVFLTACWLSIFMSTSTEALKSCLGF